MKELTVDAVLENIPSVTAFIDGQLEALDCSMKAQMQIDVAIDELFSNIARYAYPDRIRRRKPDVLRRFQRRGHSL